MNIVTNAIFTQELCPYVSRDLRERIHAHIERNERFFVFLPYNALNNPGKRQRIGQQGPEFFLVKNERVFDSMTYTILIHKLGGGKLYLYGGGRIRELTDETIDRTHAKRAIRLALTLTKLDEMEKHLEREEERAIDAEIASIRTDRERTRVYVNDDRPLKRYKYNQHAKVVCGGRVYTSLGNYIGVKKSGTAKVVCKIKF